MAACMNSTFEKAIDCTHLPDACTNDVREEKLIQRQQKDDGRNFLTRIVSRDRNLLIAGAVLAVLMNINEGRYLLYPFRIFATWIHEMCHGMAAILMGGHIAKLQIFKDGSGLAYTATSGEWRQAFVSSAGYPGTAVTGCLLLLFRRTTLGPTIGTIGLGVCLVLSCLRWVRNEFGFIALSLEGVTLILCGWKLPAVWLDNLYNFLALTCCLNAVSSIQDLFGGSYYVGGEVVTNTDAHAVADSWGGDYRVWAMIWLCLSFALTAVGIALAFDARETNWFKESSGTASPATAYTNFGSLPAVATTPYRPSQPTAPQQPYLHSNQTTARVAFPPSPSIPIVFAVAHPV
jgi:hypothetical protein